MDRFADSNLQNVDRVDESRPHGGSRAHELFISSELIEDHIQAEAPPLAQDLQRSFGVFSQERPALDSQIVALNGDKTELLHLSQSTTVPIGWSLDRARLEPKYALDRVSLSYFQNRTCALASGSQKLADDTVTQEFQFDVYQSYDSTTDSARTLTLRTHSLLGVADQEIITSDDQYWYFSEPESFELGYVFRIAKSNDDDTEIVLFRFSAGKVFQRTACRSSDGIDWIDAWQEVHLPLTEAPDPLWTEFIDRTGTKGSFLQLTKEGMLYYIRGWQDDPTATLLTGGTDQPESLIQFSVGHDSSRMLRIFALDSSNRLWLRRQTGVDDDSYFQFDDWRPLGAEYRLIRCPNVMTEYGEVIAVDPSDNIVRLQQDDSGKVWRQSPIWTPQGGSGKAIDITSSYSTELQVLDKNGGPVAGEPVEVYASRGIDVVLQGFVYNVGPTRSARAFTDGHGSIRIVFPALELAPPSLIFHVPSITPSDQGFAFNPARTVHARLADRDPEYPVNGETLVAQGLVEKKLETKAGSIAEFVTHLGQMMARETPSSGLQILQTWMVQDQDFSGIDYIASLSANLYKNRLETKGIPSFDLDLKHERDCSGSGESPCPDFVSFSIGHLFGDFAQFLKHEAHEIQEVAVEIEEDVVHFRITLDKVYHYEVETVEHAGALLDLIWRKIKREATDVEKAVERVIDWLKVLFDWHDIERTAEAIQIFIDQSFQTLEAAGAQAEDFIRSELPILKQRVSDIFSELENSTANFDQMASGHQVPQGNGGIQWSEHRQLLRKHSVRCNYLHSRWQQHVAATGPLELSLPEGLGTSLDHLLDSFEKSFHSRDLSKAFEAWRRELEGIDDLESFFARSLSSVLEVLEDLVQYLIDNLEDFVLVLLEASVASIKKLQTFFDQPIDFPLLRDITGKSLTLGEVFGFLLALPITILYKVTHKDQAPISQAELTLLKTLHLGWPGASHQLPGPAYRGSAGIPDNLWDRMARLSALGMPLYTLSDVAMDTAASNEDDPPKEVVYFHLFLEIGLQGLTVPGPSFAHWKTTALDRFVVILWCLQWLPIFGDGIAVLATSLSKEPKLIRFVDVWGPWISFGFGGGLLLTSMEQMVAAHQDPDNPRINVCNQLDDFLSTLPLIAKPVILVAQDSDPEDRGFFVGILALGDAIGDLGAGLCRYLGSLAPDSKGLSPALLTLLEHGFRDNS